METLKSINNSTVTMCCEKKEKSKEEYISKQRSLEEDLKKITENLRLKNEELSVTKEILDLVNDNLEEKVKERTSEVEKLLRQKEQFITQLGHDLKTPLTPMLGLLPLIHEREKDPELKELLGIIINNVHYMKDLVTKTLLISKLNALTIKIFAEDIFLSHEAGIIINNLQFQIKEKNMKVENKIDEKIVVRAESIYLKELIMNLISNAVKYTPEGGTITLNAEKEKDIVKISVRDSGIGMTGEQISHIFDEFYKADESRHELNSSGLGLSICKKIIERHEGRIWAKSHGLRRGTVVYFTLKSGRIDK